MRARLKVEGLQAAVHRIDVVGERARRPEPALRSRETLQDLTASEKRKFARGGWRRDTPEWIAQKRRRGLDTRTLRATGRLERTLTTGAGGMRFSAYSSTLTWGIPAGRSDLYYAQVLAKGTSSMPARRMVVIDKIAKGLIAERVGRYISDGEVTWKCSSPQTSSKGPSSTFCAAATRSTSRRSSASAACRPGRSPPLNVGLLAGEGIRLREDPLPAALLGVFGTTAPPEADGARTLSFTWQAAVQIVDVGTDREDVMLRRGVYAMVVAECLMSRVPRQGNPVDQLELIDVDFANGTADRARTVGEAQLTFAVRTREALNLGVLPPDDTPVPPGTPGGPPGAPYGPPVPWPLATSVKTTVEKEPIQ